LAGVHALIALVGAHALMREDELVKPAGVTGGPIKGLRVSKKLSLFPATETFTGPSIVSGGTRNRSHVHHTVTTTYNILRG